MQKHYNIEEISELWKNFLQGDDRAFSQLYCLFFEELMLYGQRFCPNKKIVEDLVQDIFVNIYCRKFSLEKIYALRPFLYKMLKNRIYNHMSREMRLTPINEENQEFTLLYSIDPSADEEENKTIEEVIDGLTHRQKEIIYLRFVNELSYDEIAEILNINVQSAYNLVSRSIDKLKKVNQLILFFA